MRTRRTYKMKNNDGRLGIWIDIELIKNVELDWTNKALLTEIQSLHNIKKCTASNEFFGNLLGMNNASASKRITQLVNLGYITTKDTYVERRCTGRVIIPTFKTANTGVIQLQDVGSSPMNQGVVPEQLNDSSTKNQEVVPEQLNGSSQTTNEVVPEIPDGSSPKNTINTTINTKELIQDTNTDAMEISELSLTDCSKIEYKTSIQKARAAYNEWFDDYPNWESDLLRLGADGFIKISTKYHQNNPVSLAAIRWYVTL